MVRREAIREYTAGALWVLPCISAMAALVAGSAFSLVEIGPDSALEPLLFQGTADDARTLLTAIAGTVITVIALVLGLTVVALQLSSTQFSPRLLRNFLRDRANQMVLSVFVATFVYSAAGLYTVGVSSGARTEDYPRLAVSGAILLLFVSLVTVVFFADHLAHSIQIDAVTRAVEKRTLAVVRTKPGRVVEQTPLPPSWSVRLPSTRSGYLQAAYPEDLLPVAIEHGVSVRLRLRVGEHVVAGTTLGWLWRPSPDDPPADPLLFRRAVESAVQIGFERTFEQDAAFGIRQLVDLACKALSPAINDPYSAVQAIDHLSVIFCALAERSLGDDVAADPGGRAIVIVPGRRFGDYLATMCGLIRRYGAREPTVMLALLRLLDGCTEVSGDDPDRRSAILEQAELIGAAAAREMPQPVDVAAVRAAVDTLSRPDHR
ncbi:MAG: DUF2254 domain-containing protein [Sporichthyaceae bacterium]|nr:DUF2254 domain-containing protein [Sporichthyaceae bacterium]